MDQAQNLIKAFERIVFVVEVKLARSVKEFEEFGPQKIRIELRYLAPDLVVHLDSSDEKLLQRLHKRTDQLGPGFLRDQLVNLSPEPSELPEGLQDHVQKTVHVIVFVRKPELLNKDRPLEALGWLSR